MFAEFGLKIGVRSSPATVADGYRLLVGTKLVATPGEDYNGRGKSQVGFTAIRFINKIKISQIDEMHPVQSFSRNAWVGWPFVATVLLDQLSR